MKCKDCNKKPKRKGGLVCHSCNIRRYAIKNPVKYAFFVLRQNAKRRGKEFNITFEYFKNFVNQTHYMDYKGKTKTSFTIDRKDNSLGYISGNCQILTLSENASKGTKHEGIYTDAIVTF